ncbi:MAG: TetR/AcrR family transcriptional regulator [Actinomycetota bacterium]|nr:TetR/AcrR family transcriptional regulator [Actinomycetota bacterium]
MAEDGVKRGRADHLGPERRRPQILDIALEVLSQGGYQATSMATIARAARVTRPVIYACFPAKHELFKALLDREERRLLGQIVAALPKRPNLENPEETLEQGFTGVLVAAKAAPRSWGLIFLTEHGSPEVAERVERARNGVRRELSGLPAPILAHRGIADHDDRLSRLVANLLLGNAEAGVRLMLSEPKGWPPEELGPLLGRMVAPALDVLEREFPADSD